MIPQKHMFKHMLNHRIFYVTLDPERALGLEDILPNYTIICPFKSQLTDRLKRGNVRVVVLEESITAGDVAEIARRGTYGILQFVSDRKIIVKNDYVMVLKNSQLIENFCKKQGWKLLAPKAKIAEQFENKISQYKLLVGKVPYPPTLVGETGEIYNTMLENLESRIRNLESRFLILDSPHVLQFNRGHSGNTTFFIKSKRDLDKLAKKFPKRGAKISEYIRGKTYTLNCLVPRAGKVITGSISEQITGLRAATSNPNTTCGNDFFSPRKLTGAQIEKIQKIAGDIGVVLHKKSYAGLFGIDVIIEKSTGKPYFIEINTHQPASISFEAKLHRKISKMPLLAYFVLDSLGKEIKTAEKDLPPIILPIFAKQIIYRNKTTQTLSRDNIEKKYKNKGLLSRMKRIKPNEELYRQQRIREI